MRLVSSDRRVVVAGFREDSEIHQNSVRIEASKQWHALLCSKCLLGWVSLQFLADSRVFRLIEEGRSVVIVVVHVDDWFAAGKRERGVANLAGI